MKLALYRRMIALVVFAVATATQFSARTAKPPVWIVTWAASQQIPEPQNALTPDDLRDTTVRQIFHLSLGGSAVRVHLSNVFGTEALRFTSVHVAHPRLASASAIDPASDRTLKFAGNPDVTVPPGAEFISDALEDRKSVV